MNKTKETIKKLNLSENELRWRLQTEITNSQIRINDSVLMKLKLQAIAIIILGIALIVSFFF